jgi:hypothetical protein
MCSICSAQEHINKKDSIQLCYRREVDGIGGQDHCITIYFEDSIMFCKRICYSMFTNLGKYIDTELSYQESRKQAILRHYQESNNYLVLDERVEISKHQLDELLKIIDEIKAFVPTGKSEPNEIIISAAEICYLIKDKSRTTFIRDWNARYNRSRDIEKALGLKSYLRCPCVEEDLKQINKRKKKLSFKKLEDLL